MCTNPSSFCKNNKQFNLPFLLKRLNNFYKGREEFIENNRDSFYITGGEPTLSPDLFTIIKKVNNFFPRAKIICLTNGRLFSYQDYAKEFLSLKGNLELAVSIHGHDKFLHDRITRTPGSFSQLIRGVTNILKFKRPNQIIELRVVIHKMNYKFLTKITRFIKDYFPTINRLVLIFFEIEGQSVKNFRLLKLKYTDFSSYLERNYELLKFFPDLRLYHFPYCVISEKFYLFVYRTLPAHEVRFPKVCSGCLLKRSCLGIHKMYLKFMGEEEFHILKKIAAIKNSNNWHHPIIG